MTKPTKRRGAHPTVQPKKDGQYRQIAQTAAVLDTLIQRGPQPTAALARMLRLHERTCQRFMRAMARSFPVHLLSVPGSGNPARWSLDMKAFLHKFDKTRQEEMMEWLRNPQH